MSIVVTTPTGNIGRVVTQELLDKGQQVTLIARQADKVAEFAARGAKVVEGSHADATLLTEVTRGADVLFFLAPPDLTTDDVVAQYRSFADAAVRAIAENDIPQVVNLSSIGAEVPSGTGPVAALHVVEGLLAGVAKNLIQLRPGYFMENTLGQIDSIKQANSLFTTFDSDTRIPMIATRDIGVRAAELLMDRNWTGHRVMELVGPGEVSYGEVAGVLSEVLGKQLTHVTVSPEQLVEAFIGMGASRAVGEAIAELGAAIKDGRVVMHEAPSAENRTSTTYPVFAKEVFKPAFEA